MKKFVSLLLSLLLCVSLLAVSLQAVGHAAEPDPDPTVTVIPGDPDPVNTYPPKDDRDDAE